MEETNEQQQQPNVVERAEKTLAELKEVEARIDQKREALQMEKAEMMLSGKADAGAVPPKPKEESPQEYAARVMRGDA